MKICPKVYKIWQQVQYFAKYQIKPRKIAQDFKDFAKVAKFGHTDYLIHPGQRQLVFYYVKGNKFGSVEICEFIFHVWLSNPAVEGYNRC